MSSVDFAGETVTASIEHKLDVDSAEDRCITMVNLTMSKAGLGCEFSVVFSTTWEGAFGVTAAFLSADSYCPGWSDSDEGYYELESSQGAQIDFVTHVPDSVAETSCITGEVISLSGSLTLTNWDRDLVVDLDGLSVRGDFLSVGNTSGSCPCYAECGSRECGSDPACGASCGTCTWPETCNSSGYCEEGTASCADPIAESCAYQLSCFPDDWYSLAECIEYSDPDAYCSDGPAVAACVCACSSVGCDSSAFYECADSCWSTCY